MKKVLPIVLIIFLALGCDLSAAGKKHHEGLFTVTVNYDHALFQMAEAGNYNWWDNSIVSRLSIVGRGKEFIKLVYVHLDRMATTKEVLEEMKQRSLEPAKIEHLLAFGAKYPDEQRKFPIVEIGSNWVGRDGLYHFAYLYGRDNERLLRLFWGDSFAKWFETARFLAIRQ